MSERQKRPAGSRPRRAHRGRARGQTRAQQLADERIREAELRELAELNALHDDDEETPR